MMYNLFDAASGEKIGQITSNQLRFLANLLEEESLEDKDYYINRATIDFFETKNPDPELIALLQKALGNRDDMDIRWSAA
jgi:hypothetical protein